MKKATDGKLVLLGEENSGRDEMNLAGNPFALLQAASKTGQSFIRNEWERTLPNGRIVTAKWEVNGHTELGLPGPNEELLYLVLLQITREAADEQGVWPQEVYFSRGDLLRRLKWTSNTQTYLNLSEGFSRLKAVSIEATNSFYDARAKSPLGQIGFNLIDNYELIPEPSGTKAQGTVPLSSFKWNDVVYRSMVSGNVRSFALDFAISLELPTAVRLFRYLDMMRCSTTPPRKEFAIGVMKLRDRLGMTQYKYISKVKEKLKAAIEELKSTEYLEDVRYSKAKDGTELAYFAFGKIAPSTDIEVEVIYADKSSKPKRKPKNSQLVLDVEELAPVSDIRADAIKCHTIFVGLPKVEQDELLELARRDVSPIWHDRVGQPESPMSLGLWQLVAQRYPQRLK